MSDLISKDFIKSLGGECIAARDSKTHELLPILSIDALPSAHQWIPCSERPPEEDEPVFVYLFDDSPYIAWFCGGRWHTEEFTLDKDEEPAAWMSLPELYRSNEK